MIKKVFLIPIGAPYIPGSKWPEHLKSLYLLKKKKKKEKLNNVFFEGLKTLAKFRSLLKPMQFLCISSGSEQTWMHYEG